MKKTEIIINSDIFEEITSNYGNSGIDWIEEKIYRWVNNENQTNEEEKNEK